jgi:hypothetical protein
MRIVYGREYSNDVEEWDSLGHLAILRDWTSFMRKIAGIKEMAQVDSVGNSSLLKNNSLL